MWYVGAEESGDLFWQRHLGTVVQRAQVHHWLIIELQEEVCGQLQRNGNEQEQAVAEAVHSSHVCLHGSLISRKQCLHAYGPCAQLVTFAWTSV